MKLRRGRQDKEPVIEESEEKIAVGLDIGTTKVVAFVGRKEPQRGRIEILGQGECISIGVQRGQVINIAKTTQAISQAIKQACVSSGVVIDTVVAGIAGQHVNCIHSKEEIKRKNPNKEIDNEDIRLLVDNVFSLSMPPGTQVIDAIPQEYYVDNNRDLIDPKGVIGNQFGSYFNVITGNEQHIKNIARCVKQCDLEMEDLILEPIASSCVTLDDRELESGVVLVDIGGGTTDIAIYYNGFLRHTAVIPIAGDVITEDIKQVFKGIVKEDAESIKVKHGSCIPDPSKENVVICIPGIHGRPEIEIGQNELARVIEARMKEIIDRVMVEIDASGYRDKLGCGIVLTGGGALLSGICEFTEFHTGMIVRMGYPEEKVVFSEETRQKYCNPMYATALGLMVKSFENEEDLRTESSNEVKRNEVRPPQPSEYRPKGRVADFITKVILMQDDSLEDDE
ncbi:MAG: cell division protein FtsA [Bacteroidales bacterium]|nr:cell division protein FtsA [Bacteroidales bacterium]